MAGKFGHEYDPKTQKNKRLLKRESATKKIWCVFLKEKDDINNQVDEILQVIIDKIITSV